MAYCTLGTNFLPENRASESQPPCPTSMYLINLSTNRLSPIEILIQTTAVNYVSTSHAPLDCTSATYRKHGHGPGSVLPSRFVHFKKNNTRRHQRNERRALVDDTGDGDSIHGVLLPGAEEPPALPQALPQTLLLADITGDHSSSRSSGSIATLLLLSFLRSFAVIFGPLSCRSCLFRLESV